MSVKNTLFLDTITGHMDIKGRVSIPADYRFVLDNMNAQLVLYRSFTAPCIEGVGSPFLQKIADGIENNYAYFSNEQQDLSTLIFSESKIYIPDSTGRILLSPKLIAHAGLTDGVAFVGKGKTFQIWNPEQLIAEQQKIYSRLKEAPLTLSMKGE